jgi:type I restriction enzyme, S subunit
MFSPIPVFHGPFFRAAIAFEIGDRTPLPEQHEMFRRLDVCDNRLQAEQTYVMILRQIKSGLMQDLLTGKVRVKVDEEAVNV